MEVRQSRLSGRLLSGGALYFSLAGAAHLLGFKLPLLFIYYDLPSTAYQDRIIGALLMGWSLWFWRESQSGGPSRALLSAGGLALAALAWNTLNLPPIEGDQGGGTLHYWGQLLLLGMYLIALALRTRR